MKLKGTEVIQSKFSDGNVIKLESNNKENLVNSQNTLLSNQWANKEVMENQKKIFS